MKGLQLGAKEDLHNSEQTKYYFRGSHSPALLSVVANPMVLDNNASALDTDCFCLQQSKVYPLFLVPRSIARQPETREIVRQHQ